MAIIQCIPVSCKAELLQGIHNFGSDVFKIALYDNTADLGPSTTIYTSVGEVSGTGYVAGGQELTGQDVLSSNGSAWVYWDDPSWAGADFYASGAMIYNSDVGNRAVLILNFGTQRLFSSTSNTIQFPPSTATEALMRIT